MKFSQLINLPNTLTLINLLSGSLACIFLFHNHTALVPACVLISLIADFFDGFAARFTKNSSAIGKELDSLADMVSFGLLPAVILFSMLYQLWATTVSGFLLYLYAAPALLIALFAALRLAKFNLDSRQTEGFIGLATPAVTIFITGLLLIVQHDTYGLSHFIQQTYFLYTASIAFSFLMIAELPMFSFKFKSFSWKSNELRYLFLLLSVISLATFTFAGISLIILLYILISLAQKIIAR